ncbi:MAG: heme exporter protein CcmD [Rhabdaerophilum sp.]
MSTMGKHFGFIAGSYVVAAIILGVMILCAILSYRGARQRLARIEGAKSQP